MKSEYMQMNIYDTSNFVDLSDMMSSEICFVSTVVMYRNHPVLHVKDQSDSFGCLCAGGLCRGGGPTGGGGVWTETSLHPGPGWPCAGGNPETSALHRELTSAGAGLTEVLETQGTAN